jgi:hypothetical protein
MLAAVDFYNESFFDTDEINNVWGYRMLPAKLETREVSVSQELPKAQFCVG